MDCPCCQHANDATANFCEECGARLGASTCATCGAEQKASAKFCPRCGTQVGASTGAALARAPRAYTPKHLADKILQSKSALEGERKQVTVLFADVKGSMELAEQVDPEEWHTILDRFFQILTDGVHRFEGTVNQYTGDGIMALFGAPIAHEDHAQRACYAALHLRSELRRYADDLRVSRGLNLAVRMGLNSGDVVVGRIGDDLRMDYTAQGHTVGLAQRMETIAESGQAFVTAGTARLVEGYFALRDLGSMAVKGGREPVRVYALEGVGAHRTRFDLSRARGFSKFVGRADDMAVLEAARERGSGGRGQIVGVVAEAGTGKSRLCFEFAERCRARGLPVYEAHALAHGKQMPLLPVLELYRSFFGIGERDADRLAREKIAGRLLLLDEALRDELPVVFDMLGVADPAHPLPMVDPEAHQQRLFRAIQRIVRADRTPSVLLFEDLHWIDAASDAVLAQIIEAAAHGPGLVLVNFRPEYHARWMQRSDYQQLALVPLGPAAIRELLGDLLGCHASTAALPDLIHARTGGNPYFIEEVVQTLVETGAVAGRRGAYELTRPIESLAVPPTVQAVLGARIDRLAEREKHVLQVASVIGKRVPLELLRRVVNLPEAELGAAAAVLKEREFLYEAALYPEIEHAFKHPLTEQVAYESQLREGRARSHAAVARVIEDVERDRLDESAALLAHHWAEAGERLVAARWHRRAAAWIAPSDPGQAAHHWRRVLACTEGREEEDAAALAAEACCEMQVVGWRLGLPDEDLRAILARCRAACARIDDPATLGHALLWYAVNCNFRGALNDGLEPLNEALVIAQRLHDTRIEAGVRCTLQDRALFLGDLEEAHVQCERVIALVGEDPHHMYVPTLSSFIESLGKRGMIRSELGRLVEGVADLERALRLAEDGTMPEDTLIISLLFDCYRVPLFGATAEAAARAQRLVRLAEGSGNQLHIQTAHHCAGAVHATLGQWDAAIAHLERSRQVTQQRGIAANEPMVLAGLADAYRAVDRLADARAAAAAGVDVGRRHGMRTGECRVQIALARVLIAEGATDTAAIDAALIRAQALVAETKARVYLPFIAEVRAELARARGDAAGAVHLLADAHRLFTEMGATGHTERLATELGLGPESAARRSTT
jgi:class 3 adenylate cyclase/tetratricopeptide (TPR) repeat protein